MEIVFLSLIGVVLFVVGVSFVFKGYLSTPRADAVVAKGDFESIQKVLATVKEAESKAENELNACKVELATVRQGLELTRKNEEQSRQEVERLRTDSKEFINRCEAQIAENLAQIEGLKTENANLLAGMGQYKEQLPLLQAEISGIQQKTVAQAEGALEVIDSLTQQVESLKTKDNSQGLRIKELEEQVAQDKNGRTKRDQASALIVENLQKERDFLKAELESHLEKIDQLEKELVKVRQEREQRLQNHSQEILTLQQGKESFTAAVQEKTIKIHQLEEEIAQIKEKNDRRVYEASVVIHHLKEDKESLFAAVQQSQAKIKQLEAQLSVSQQIGDKQEVDLVGMIDSVKAENESLRIKEKNNQMRIHELSNELGVVRETFKLQLAEAQTLIEGLKSDREKLKAVQPELNELARLREYVSNLVQKEKLVQFELVRKSAQAIALEKICADFKIKVENFDKLQTELKETKNRLTMLEQQKAVE